MNTFNKKKSHFVLFLYLSTQSLRRVEVLRYKKVNRVIE